MVIGALRTRNRAPRVRKRRRGSIAYPRHRFALAQKSRILGFSQAVLLQLPLGQGTRGASRGPQRYNKRAMVTQSTNNLANKELRGSARHVAGRRTGAHSQATSEGHFTRIFGISWCHSSRRLLRWTGRRCRRHPSACAASGGRAQSPRVRGCLRQRGHRGASSARSRAG